MSTKDILSYESWAFKFFYASSLLRQDQLFLLEELQVNNHLKAEKNSWDELMLFGQNYDAINALETALFWAH